MDVRNFGVEVGLLMLVAFIAGIMNNAVSDRGISWVGQWKTEKGVVTPLPKKDAELFQARIEIFDPETVKQLFDAKKTLFVDARSEAQYAEGHIPGAVLFPAFEIEERLMGFMDQVPPETDMVIYCSGRECPASHEIASALMEMGYGSIRVFVDGFPEWKKRGYPIER